MPAPEAFRIRKLSRDSKMQPTDLHPLPHPQYKSEDRQHKDETYNTITDKTCE
jgi:hypothetical protein